jgi:hypothetical protein
MLKTAKKVRGKPRLDDLKNCVANNSPESFRAPFYKSFDSYSLLKFAIMSYELIEILKKRAESFLKNSG